MIVLFFVLMLGLAKPSLAYEESAIVKVMDVVEEKEMDFDGIKQPYQLLEAVVIEGENVGETIYISNGEYLAANVRSYQAGDKLVVGLEKIEGEVDYYYIVDFVRTGALTKLVVIFVVVTLVVAKWRGLWSMIAMVVSFGIIFKFILPNILAGANPIMVAVGGALAIVPVTFYMSHGLNKKTTVAVVATIITLIITGILAVVFVEMSKLTGLAAEEAGFVVSEMGDKINLKNLLLAGIIVGVLGVLDDVTVSQAGVVEKLSQAGGMDKYEVYKKAMEMGRDHIASMVNTLILVYAGASLPLLLLFVNNPHPFAEIINYEVVADEIVRTMVGSIGLVLAVPIATVLATVWFEKGK